LRDEARALAFLIENNISGPVNLVGPQPATSGTLMKALSKLMSRPYWFPAPGFAISLVLGQAGRELLLSSQKISPEVLLSSGFTFLDSDVSEGLHSALG
jgi:NAD dependent epimerase/dehydratase family enzyme